MRVDRTPPHLSAPCALYRLFGDAGELLYVGITNHPRARFRAHAKNRWWLDVERIEVEWFDHRSPAEDAERVAIWQEHPRYNRQNLVLEQYKPRPDARACATLPIYDAMLGFAAASPHPWDGMLHELRP